MKKYAKMVLLGLKTHLKKKFPRLFLSQKPSYTKNWVKMVSKQVFIGEALKAPPQLDVDSRGLNL